MLPQFLIRGFPLVVIGGLCCPSQAAAKGIILITHGDTINHVGEVAQKYKEVIRQETQQDVAVGYMYSYFGIFWLDLWTWGGTYCLYKDKNVWALPREQAAEFLGKHEDELGTPFFYKFPPGLMIIIGIVAVAVPVKVFKKRSVNIIQKLFEDVRYQKALEIISQHADKEETAEAAKTPDGAAPEEMQAKPAGDTGFEAAIQSLMSEGIDRKDAEENLGLMLMILAQAHAEEQGQAPAPPA